MARIFFLGDTKCLRSAPGPLASGAGESLADDLSHAKELVMSRSFRAGLGLLLLAALTVAAVPSLSSQAQEEKAAPAARTHPALLRPIPKQEEEPNALVPHVRKPRFCGVARAL